MRRMMIAMGALVLCVSQAEAKPHKHHHYVHHRHYQNIQPTNYQGGFDYPAILRPNYSHDRRPAAWCGWEMRRLVSHDPGPSFNLARNWSHWGRAGPAGIGAVVVWPHHVGKIVGQNQSGWVIESGNDGHALRTRPRSIAGAIAIRWG